MKEKYPERQGWLADWVIALMRKTLLVSLLAWPLELLLIKITKM
jgi:hypothetical protein